MFDPQTLHIAVALIKPSQGQIAISWNDNWQAFVLPMTKLDSEPPAETAEQAAIRAAAEVLQLPVRLVPEQQGREMRKLQLSNRDGEIKDYHFTLVPVEPHPDFQVESPRTGAILLVEAEKLRDGEYQPLSPSVQPILNECVQWGWL